MEKKHSELLLQALKGKHITILGHDNIDVDAVLSGVLMSRLLNFLGIENEFMILEKVKKDDTYEIVEEIFGIGMEQWENVSEDENRTLLLLDHYETVHKGHVVACIDHHPTKQTKDYDFIYSRNSCATAYLIFEIMREVGYRLSKEDAQMIVLSMMVDTTAFRSSKTISREVEDAKALANRFYLNYIYLEKVSLCLTPIDKMSVEEIISNGQKWYNYNGNKVGSSYLQLYDFPDKVTIDKWYEALRKKRIETESKMLVFIIFDTQLNLTYEIRFSEEGMDVHVYTKILSRGKDIMPKIEAMFCK